MKNINKTLTKYGLTDNEIQVYLACVKESGLSPHRLSKLTGIPRTTVYDTLTNLSLKKLITLKQSDGYTKQQTRVDAVNPSKLRKIIRERKEELDDLELDILDILPDIKKAFMKNRSNTDFRFYSGIEGFKKIYFNRDITPDFVWNDLASSDLPGRDSIREIVDSLVEYPLLTKELIPLSSWTKHVLSVQTARNKKYVTNRNMRYIDSSFFDINTWLSVKSNRIAIACAHEDEAWGLVINSKALANTLRSIFELAWVAAKPVTLDFVKSLGKSGLYKSSKRRNIKL